MGPPRLSYRSEEEALKKMRTKKQRGVSRVGLVPVAAAGVPGDVGEGEERAYRDVSSQAMLELLHSDRFRPQLDHITTVFHKYDDEAPTTVPIEILQAVEHRAKVLQVKAASYKAAIVTADKKVKGLETKVKSLTTSLKETTEKSEKLTDENNLNKALVGGLREEVSELVEELVVLRNSSEEVMENNRHYVSKCEAMEHLLEEANQENTRLMEQVVRQESELSEYEKNEKEMLEKIKELTLDLDFAKETVAVQDLRIRELENMVDGLNERMSKMRMVTGDGGDIDAMLLAASAAARARALCSVSYEKHELSVMAALDYDAPQSDACIAGLKRPFKKEMLAKFSKEYQQVVIPRADSYTLEAEAADVEAFVTKQRNVRVKHLTAMQLDVLAEASRLAGNVCGDLVQLVTSDMPEVFRVIPPGVVPRDAMSLLYRRHTEFHKILEKAFGAMLKLQVQGYTSFIQHMQGKIKDAVHFCGGPCSKPVAAKHTMTEAARLRSESMQTDIVLTTDRGVGRATQNKNGVPEKNEEIDMEAHLMKLSSAIKAILTATGHKEAGFPPGLKIKGKQGNPLLSANVDGAQMILDKLRKGGRAGYDAEHGTEAELHLPGGTKANDGSKNRSMGDKLVQKRLKEMAHTVLTKERVDGTGGGGAGGADRTNGGASGGVSASRSYLQKERSEVMGASDNGRGKRDRTGMSPHPPEESKKMGPLRAPRDRFAECLSNESSALPPI